MKAIELGGGENPSIRPNVDSRKMETVDIVANLEEPLPLPSNEYELVLAKFIIEHISWRKIKGFVAEVYRILQKGGKAIIVTANLKEQARIIAEKQVWDGTESIMIFGDQDHEGNYHKCGFSPEYLTKLFFEAGFRNVSISSLPQCATDMMLQAYKL